MIQCLRRWIDEGDKLHLANGAKYFSAMMAAGISLTRVSSMSKAAARDLGEGEVAGAREIKGEGVGAGVWASARCQAWNKGQR